MHVLLEAAFTTCSFFFFFFNRILVTGKKREKKRILILSIQILNDACIYLLILFINMDLSWEKWKLYNNLKSLKFKNSENCGCISLLGQISFSEHGNYSSDCYSLLLFDRSVSIMPATAHSAPPAHWTMASRLQGRQKRLYCKEVERC